jgi:two-component SAPR family response regulator
MIHMLIVSKDRQTFSNVVEVFARSRFEIDWRDSGATALSLLLKKPYDLLIIEEALPDMTGRNFIESVVKTSPMINCIVASPLTKKKFHHAYEGLGVLMQFTITPGRKEAQNLLDHYKQILRLHNKINTLGESDK